MTEKHCPDLLAGYCLDALDPAERDQAAAHVAGCPDCSQEAATLANCLHATLGHECLPVSPSPLARTRFLARLALELAPEDVRPVAPVIVQTPVRPLRQLFVPRWLFAVAAVPAFAALLFAVGWLGMKHQYDDQHANLLADALRAPHAAMVLQGPAVQHGMTGEVIVPTSANGGLLIVAGLSHNVSSHMGYVCWLEKAGHWSLWGPLTPDGSGLAMFVMNGAMDPHHASALEITLEHTDRPMANPTGAMLLGTVL